MMVYCGIRCCEITSGVNMGNDSNQVGSTEPGHTNRTAKTDTADTTPLSMGRRGAWRCSARPDSARSRGRRAGGGDPATDRLRATSRGTSGTPTSTPAATGCTTSDDCRPDTSTRRRGTRSRRRSIVLADYREWERNSSGGVRSTRIRRRCRIGSVSIAIRGVPTPSQVTPTGSRRSGGNPQSYVRRRELATDKYDGFHR